MQNNLVIDENNISTWYAEHMDVKGGMPYIAINMSQVAVRLEGYGLTDEEKTNIPDLMAGYCRLVDERGLCGYGRNEFEAIQELFAHATMNDCVKKELPKNEWHIIRYEDFILLGRYTINNWLQYDKYLISELPNNLIRLDDFKNLPIISIERKTT